MNVENMWICSLVLWLAVCNQAFSANLTEFPVEEGKPVTLNCSGKVTRSLKQIWWTARSAYDNRTTRLSKCYIGQKQEDFKCTNFQSQRFTATNSGIHSNYKSMLTIHSPNSDDRGLVINCEEESKHSNVQSFSLFVYYNPESPICKAEEIPRGCIEVSCNTFKVYPGIQCEIQEEFRNTTGESNGDGFTIIATHVDVKYTVSTIRDKTAEYKSARCHAVIHTKLTGSYRFKVKMTPNVTNTLVAPIDGYTNVVTLHSESDRARKNSNNSGLNEEQVTTSKLGYANIAEPLTADANNILSDRQAVNEDKLNNRQRDNEETKASPSEMACESDKDIHKQQLIVILILIFLLVVMVLINAVMLFRNICSARPKDYV